MANPKYADLPGIASDQPDTYETNELPESDQRQSPEGFEDQTIEKLSVSTAKSYEKFKDKTLDASDVDFTESIQEKKKKGYGVLFGDWEMSESRENETPHQKYQRLRHELQELLDEVEKAKTSDSTDLQTVNLAGPVEQLQEHLSNFNLQNVLHSKTIADLNDPHSMLEKQMVNEIEAFKKPAGDKSSTSGKPVKGATGEGITYQLYYKTDSGNSSNTALVADLEQRLKKLEGIIGNDVSKLSLMTATNQKTVLGAIDNLSAKMRLLDPNSLDRMEARLVALNQLLQQINEKKSARQEDIEKQGRVTELYDLLKKTERMGNNLDQVVERLMGLQELHEQALQFSKALTQLDTVQQQIAASLKNDEKSLQETKEAFMKNTETIMNNIQSLDQRLSKIKK